MVALATTNTLELACPSCDSKGVNKVGMRDGYQRYQCKACKKKFHAKGTAPGKRFPTEQVGTAIQMFYSGMSYKQTAENVAKTYDIRAPSKRTISKWVKEYTQKALDHMQTHKAHVGVQWVVHRMPVEVGGKRYMNWDVMDSKTGYILASHLSERSDAREAQLKAQVYKLKAQINWFLRQERKPT